MTVAKLGIKVDVTQLTEATAALNELVAAAERAEQALERLGFIPKRGPTWLELITVATVKGQSEFYQPMTVGEGGPGSGGNEPT